TSGVAPDWARPTRARPPSGRFAAGVGRFRRLRASDAGPRLPTDPSPPTSSHLGGARSRGRAPEQAFSQSSQRNPAKMQMAGGGMEVAEAGPPNELDAKSIEVSSD